MIQESFQFLSISINWLVLRQGGNNLVKIIINQNKCEGKAKCLEVCPENVFDLKEPDPKYLSRLMKIKLRFHGGKQAFAVNPENCNVCNACVDICPEKAIVLFVS